MKMLPVANLALTALSEIGAEDFFFFSFLCFRENIWHFMWTVCPADDSYGMPILLKKIPPFPPTIILSQADLSNCWGILPISKPKPDFPNINAYTKFGEIPLTFTHYCPETKILTCLGRATPLKIDEICPSAIPNQISTISMHIPSLV